MNKYWGHIFITVFALYVIGLCIVLNDVKAVALILGIPTVYFSILGILIRRGIL